MLPDEFVASAPGELVQFTSPNGDKAYAFIPSDLPPTIRLAPEVAVQAEIAAYALGNLDGLGRLIPNPTLLARPFIRKEALASSRIEGTRAEYDRLVVLENDPWSREMDNDYREVSNQVQALIMAWEAMSSIPAVSLPGIASLHRILLTGVRGEQARPGEYRSQYVMIGRPSDTFATAGFVPVPPQEVRPKLENLMVYVQGHQAHIPLLAQLAIIHYQFEAIHPFLDGNGRIGRMLIPLVLREWGLLHTPLLYLSEYLERNRSRYLDLLEGVSKRGEWQEWISFFLLAVRAQSEDALTRGQSILGFREELRTRYQTGRSVRLLPIIDALFELPSITNMGAQELTGLSRPASNALVKTLVDDGVLVEATGRQRNQVFYAPEIARLSMGISVT